MPAPQELSERLGRYRILKRLGAGGMGAVYLAEDTTIGRKVALKVPHFDAETKPAVIERFQREARIAAGIHHPNLCAVFDVGEIDGIHFFTMPYIEGVTLSRQIDEAHPWKPADAAQLVRKIALAVGALHQRGIVHRDLKPSNIMMGEGGEPVLMDFGLARSFTAQSERLTTTGAPMGSPSYMAPEQVGDGKDIGRETDVYGLGVIFYELITGKLPFQGPMMSLFAQILHSQVPPPSSVRLGLDPRLDAFCLKALAKRPAERFRDMNSFAEALLECTRSSTYPSSRDDSTAQPTNPTLLAPPSMPPVPPSIAPRREAPQAEPTRLTCPQCQGTIKVTTALAGRKVKCPHCHTGLGRIIDPEARTDKGVFGRSTVLGASLETSTGDASRSKSALEEDAPATRARRWRTVILAVVAVLALGGIAFVVVSHLRPPPNPGPGEPRLELGSVADATLDPGQTISVAVKLRRVNCPDTVEIRALEPTTGVTLLGVVSAEADEGRLNVAVDATAKPGVRLVRLQARSGSVSAETVWTLTIRPAAGSPVPSQKFRNNLGMDLMPIRKGRFRMGSTADELKQLVQVVGSFAKEGPQHDVEIVKDFHMSATEVTVGQFKEFIKANPGFKTDAEKADNASTWRNPGFAQEDDHPVVFVSWNDAEAFCKWLSKEDGKPYDLPTEAEWEYACRAETTTAYSFGDACDGTQANCDGTNPYGTKSKGPNLGKTCRVRQYAANPWGLYNMHGNVWEWCQDGIRAYQVGFFADPRGDVKGEHRVVRGGSWGSNAIECRSAVRFKYPRDTNHEGIGFRVVCRSASRTP